MFYAFVGTPTPFRARSNRFLGLVVFAHGRISSRCCFVKLTNRLSFRRIVCLLLSFQAILASRRQLSAVDIKSFGEPSFATPQTRSQLGRCKHPARLCRGTSFAFGFQPATGSEVFGACLVQSACSTTDRSRNDRRHRINRANGLKKNVRSDQPRILSHHVSTW